MSHPCCHRPVLALALILLCVAAEAETRTWTDVQGRTVEAEFVSYAAGTVKLKIPQSGTVYGVPMERLSERDRTYIRSLASARRAATQTPEEVVQFSDEEVKRADRFLAERIRTESFLAVNIEGKKHFDGDLRTAGFFAAMEIRKVLESGTTSPLDSLAKAIQKLDTPGITVLLESVSLDASKDDVTQVLGPSLTQERGTVTTNGRGTITESNSRNVRSTRAMWLKCAYLAVALTKPGDPGNGIVAVDCSAFLRCHPVP